MGEKKISISDVVVAIVKVALSEGAGSCRSLCGLEFSAYKTNCHLEGQSAKDEYGSAAVRTWGATTAPEAKEKQVKLKHGSEEAICLLYVQFVHACSK